MEHTVGDFCRSALVEEIGSQVTADAPAHIHPVLIPVAAVGAFPDKLAVILHDTDFPVITTDLTVIRFRVQLGIHDVVVDEPHDREHSRDVVLHVGNFHIADCSARGKRLELRLKAEF